MLFSFDSCATDSIPLKNGGGSTAEVENKHLRTAFDTYLKVRELLRDALPYVTSIAVTVGFDGQISSGQLQFAFEVRIEVGSDKEALIIPAFNHTNHRQNAEYVLFRIHNKLAKTLKQKKEGITNLQTALESIQPAP